MLHTIGGETLERSWRVLRKRGVLVSIVSPIPPGVAEQHGARAVFFIVNGNRGQLDQISTLVNEGMLKPIIAELFPLARARGAFERGAGTHSLAKSYSRLLPAEVAYFRTKRLHACGIVRCTFSASGANRNARSRFQTIAVSYPTSIPKARVEL